VTPSWRRIASRLALALVSVLLTVALAEGALRLWFWHQGVSAGSLRDRLARSEQASLGSAEGRFSVYGLVRASTWPDIVYELKPNLVGSFRGQPVRTNSLGLRGPEVSPRKSPGTFRIVGLGDSHMFGWGVGQDETYLARLQALLDAAGATATPGQRFEVLNFGVPGYNTTMEVATLEHRGMAMDPDLVVIHFVGNDFGLPHFLQPPGAALTPARWYLVELMRAVLGHGGDDDGQPALLDHEMDDVPAEERHAARQQYKHMAGEEAYRVAMDRLAELTAERGIPVVVLTLGDGEGRQLVVEAAKAHGFTLLAANGHFAEYLAAQAGPHDRDSWRGALQIPDDGHPSALAHRLYSEVLFGEMARRGLVTATPGEPP
jgi:lysophospholipase L1-like esterase